MSMKLPKIRTDIRQYITTLSRESSVELSTAEIDEMSKEAAREVEETTQQSRDLNMNRSFGSLISDPNVQPFEEMDATIGEIQKDVDKLEASLEELGDELEAQEREYERLTEAPEDEGYTGRHIRAHKANKERMMYKAKLEAFEDIRQRLKRKVRILSEMVREEMSSQTDQNFDLEEHAEQVDEALGARERESISENRTLEKIDTRLDGMQNADDMSVQKDLEVIEEKSGHAVNHQTELSQLADELLGAEESEQSERTPNLGED